jgi:hypothetical protein
VPNSKEAPSPEHVSLLENLREAYRIKQEISAWYRDTLTRALASGVSTAVIARYVGVTPQAISTARIRLRPSGKPESDVPGAQDRRGYDPGHPAHPG